MNMEQINKKQIYYDIEKTINTSKLFENPVIDLILDINDKNERIVYLHEFEKEQSQAMYVINQDETLTETQINQDDENNIYSEPFYSTFEGAFFKKLNESNTNIIYISLDFHISLWKFIDNHYDEICLIIDSLIEYAIYCKSTGINHTIINEYSDVELLDILNFDEEDYEEEFDEDGHFLDFLQCYNIQVMMKLMEQNKIMINDYFHQNKLNIGDYYD